MQISDNSKIEINFQFKELITPSSLHFILLMALNPPKQGVKVGKSSNS
jgi:hypothetical protein